MRSWSTRCPYTPRTILSTCTPQAVNTTNGGLTCHPDCRGLVIYWAPSCVSSDATSVAVAARAAALLYVPYYEQASCSPWLPWPVATRRRLAGKQATGRHSSANGGSRRTSTDVRCEVRPLWQCIYWCSICWPMLSGFLSLWDN